MIRMSYYNGNKLSIAHCRLDISSTAKILIRVVFVFLAAQKYLRVSFYSRVAPKKEETKTTRPHTRGPNEKSAGRPPATDLEVLVLLDVGCPLPAVAVPVLPAPASCEPAPERPGPLPAPLLKYWLACGGIAGRASPLTNQVLDLEGQMLGEPVDL